MHETRAVEEKEPRVVRVIRAAQGSPSEETARWWEDRAQTLEERGDCRAREARGHAAHFRELAEMGL